MLTPGLALIAQPWIRHREGMQFTAATLALLLLASRIPVPALGEGWWLAPLLIVAILSAASAYILNSILFLEREGDLSSGYPRRLFVLPTSTTTLVVWPMLINVATVSVLWLFASVLAPYSPRPVPRLLPILGLAAAVSWLQAMVWCPFGAGWYRLIVCTIVYCALVMPPIIAQTVMGRVVPWELLMVLYMLGAWGVAYWAVSRARRGDVWLPRLAAAARFWDLVSRAVERRRRFRSPASAQLWYEERCHLWMLPVVTLWFLGFFGCVLAFTPLQADRPGLVTPFLFGLAAATPSIMAISVSVRLGGFEPFWRLTPASIGFAGTRPMTTQALVVSKFRIALMSALLTWAGVVFLVTAAIVVTGNWTYAVDLARAVAAHYDGWSLCLIVVLGLIVGPVLTWTCLTSGLPASLSGRRWTAEAYSWSFAIGVMSSAVPLIWLVGRHDSVRVFHQALPWIIGVLAILKAIVVYVGFRAAIAGRLIDGRYTASALTIWLAVALCTASLAWLAASPFDHPVPFVEMLAAGAVVSPLSRFGLSPLALDRNRHR